MSSFRVLSAIGSIMLLSIVSAGVLKGQDATEEARRFVREHEANIQPLEIENARAWWKANVSGKDEDFAAKEQAENRLNDALSSSEKFERLKKVHAGPIDDTVLKREIDVLYLQY